LLQSQLLTPLEILDRPLTYPEKEETKWPEVGDMVITNATSDSELFSRFVGRA
jgi:hypothetical protein